MDVDCEQAREATSALLDGEEPGLDQERSRAHLTRCRACQDWADDAARINRLARLSPADPVPDIAAVVVPELGRPWRARLRPVVWAALLLVALAQVALGLLGLFPVFDATWLSAAHSHVGDEVAAFNVAVGIALLWILRHTGQARGLLPLLLAFVAVLAGTEVVDLLAGHEHWARPLTHLPVVAGLLLAWALVRCRLRTEPGPGGTLDAAAAEPGAPAAPSASPIPCDEQPGARTSPPAARSDAA